MFQLFRLRCISDDLLFDALKDEGVAFQSYVLLFLSAKKVKKYLDRYIGAGLECFDRFTLKQRKDIYDYIMEELATPKKPIKISDPQFKWMMDHIAIIKKCRKHIIIRNSIDLLKKSVEAAETVGGSHDQYWKKRAQEVIVGGPNTPPSPVEDLEADLEGIWPPDDSILKIEPAEMELLKNKNYAEFMKQMEAKDAQFQN